jgi:hypothetical protein
LKLIVRSIREAPSAAPPADQASEDTHSEPLPEQTDEIQSQNQNGDRTILGTRQSKPIVCQDAFLLSLQELYGDQRHATEKTHESQSDLRLQIFVQVLPKLLIEWVHL